ncbi:HEAT repeat domain-containing protein [Syntrophobacter fumaroxidans]|uniref:HEAT domain containing protein n=1 Tax=Syntrophobacter fumaroxidans (strain DSM 10017 / MPOB) TaxID=335543 RepID=A0LGB4_SYNFM|nr:HEAT repeat domain-containing protein [Syntrophobacter fumaroxidans]ABK16466.1 HEAT domain containing protein [Syntrophobacter fumaroxidans MPOB]
MSKTTQISIWRNKYILLIISCITIYILSKNVIPKYSNALSSIYFGVSITSFVYFSLTIAIFISIVLIIIELSHLSKYRIVNIFISIFKWSLATLIISPLIVIILNIWIIPTIKIYQDTPKYKKLAYSMILQALKTDPDLEVRKNAVLGLRKIGDLESINTLSEEMTKQPALAGLIGQRISKPKQTEKIDKHRLLGILKQMETDDTLSVIEYKQKILREASQTRRVLRNLKEVFSGSRLTDAERTIVQVSGLSNSISEAINQLNLISKIYSTIELNDDFPKTITHLNSVINAFDKTYGDESAIAQSNSLLSDLGLLVKVCRTSAEQFGQSLQRKPSKLTQYKHIIVMLTRIAPDESLELFRKIVKNDKVPVSIRKAVTLAIGDIGKPEDYQLLTELFDSPHSDIRISAIQSISFMLYRESHPKVNNMSDSEDETEFYLDFENEEEDE